MPVFHRFWFDPATRASRPEDLLLRGAALAIEIGVPQALAAALTAQGVPLPAPVAGSALLDTGASASAVDLDVLRRLGLHPTSTVQLVTPSGPTLQGVFVVRLSFPGTPIPIHDPRPVVGSDLRGFGHIALLGRDLLLGALLIYDGQHGHWTIAF